LITTLQI